MRASVIPNTIHQIWMDASDELNPKPSIPMKFQTFINKWRSMHPDYTHILWNGESMRLFVKTYYPSFISIYDAFPKWIYRCDMFRYLLLEHEGGIYIDADVEPVKHISSLLSYIPQGHDAMLSYEKGGNYITNAIIVSIARSGLWMDYLKYCIGMLLEKGTDACIKNVLQQFCFQNFRLHEWYNPELIETYFGLNKLVIAGCSSVLETVGVYALTEFMSKVMYTRKVHILKDSTILFPWSLATTSTERMLAQIPPTTVALHHFASTWFDKTPYKDKSLFSVSRDFPCNNVWIDLVKPYVRICRICEPRKLVDLGFYQGDVFTTNMTFLHSCDENGKTILYAVVKQNNQRFPLGSKGKALYWSCLWEMDPDTLELRRILQFPPDARNCPEYSIGRQDPRIFRRKDGSLSILYNYECNTNKLFKVCIQSLDKQYRLSSEVHPVFFNIPTMQLIHQKNWCPFYFNQSPKFVYHVYPELSIGNILGELCMIEHVYPTTVWINRVLDYWCPERVKALKAGEHGLELHVHSGTNLIHIPEYKLYLGLMHIKDKMYCRYNTMWYGLQDTPPFEPIGCSMPFRLDWLTNVPDLWDVIFCPGLERITTTSKDTIIGSFSQNDERMIMFEIDIKASGLDWISKAVSMHPYDVSVCQKAIQSGVIGYKPNDIQKILVVGTFHSGVTDVFNKLKSITTIDIVYIECESTDNLQQFCVDARNAIVVVRRNPLYRYISLFKNRIEGNMLRFDTDTFMDVSKACSSVEMKLNRLCQSLGKPVVWIDYESAMEVHQGSYYMVNEINKCYALEINSDTKSEFERSEKLCLAREISNMKEMIEFLANRKWLSLLSESSPSISVEHE